MKILICEEDGIVSDELKKKLMEIVAQYTDDHTIILENWSNAFGLCECINDNNVIPDAIIMDVNFGKSEECNGIELAKQIKEKYKDMNFIFLANCMDNIADAFETEPLYVLFKPIDDEKLKDAMKKLHQSMLDDRNRRVTIKAIKEIKRVLVKQINYMESHGRQVIIHTEDEEIVTTGKLEMIKELLGNGFIQCHKSYVVNYNKIVSYDYDKLTLINETKIQVSRCHKKDVRNMLLNSLHIY